MFFGFWSQAHWITDCPTLKAHGCNVLALDLTKISAPLLNLLEYHLSSHKESDPLSWCMTVTGGVGVDGVLIAATTSSDPIHRCSGMS